MDLSKQIRVAGLAAAIGLGFCPASEAQVSCSPKVPERTCKKAATLLDARLKSESGPGRGGVQLELVSPEEFKDRIAQFKKDLHLGPVESPGCGPGSGKTFFQNCAEVDVLFFRGSPSDVIPKRIVASSAEAGDALWLLYFIEGYYAGLRAEMAESQNEK
jgi:hypothetical protein